ncbi:MAG: type II toxin-antitoxin system VapC family toxin [candidate division NC10 bacterium]|nr:type II toxin-antitoxin system VapC family toxin [candidate division NC10 bacterium]MDE2321614.1 type II toxin-antitoxin system VapC family toxin [candidate division NC10 bacterium]
MKRTVLDSYAVLAFLFKEKGYEKVLDLFEKAAQTDQVLLIAAPNWAEVRYMVERKAGAERWSEVRHKLLGLPLEVVPADQTLAEIAGEIKASRKMSLADCFAAALAKQKKADVYIGDPEFKSVEKDIRVLWL